VAFTKFFVRNFWPGPAQILQVCGGVSQQPFFSQQPFSSRKVGPPSTMQVQACLGGFCFFSTDHKLGPGQAPRFGLGNRLSKLAGAGNSEDGSGSRACAGRRGVGGRGVPDAPFRPLPCLPWEENPRGVPPPLPPLWFRHLRIQAWSRACEAGATDLEGGLIPASLRSNPTYPPRDVSNKTLSREKLNTVEEDENGLS